MVGFEQIVMCLRWPEGGLWAGLEGPWAGYSRLGQVIVGLGWSRLVLGWSLKGSCALGTVGRS